MKNRCQGLSIIELLVALSILITLLNIAIPNFTELVEKKRAQVILNELYHSINFARNHAVLSRKNVVICPSTNHKNCINDWTQTLIIFEDHNKNFQFDGSIDQLLTEVNLNTAENASIAWKSFGSKPYIRFNAYGTTAFQNGRIFYCDASKKQKQQLIVYRTGRTRYALGSHKKDTC